MRTIKFRAWHKPLSKMHENVQETYDSDPSGIFGGSNAIHACFGSILDEKDFEVMQFTGLLDKNGKEIYDGDIVKWCDDLLQVTPYGTGFGLRGEMFRRGGFCTCDIAGQYMIKSEVIGNIYEHPELLNPITK